MKAKKEKSEIPINQPKWITEIEAICNEQGILPEDMVREWKEMKKGELNSKIKFSKTTDKSFEGDKKTRFILDEIGVMAATPPSTGLSKWQLELRKKKLGI